MDIEVVPPGQLRQACDIAMSDALIKEGFKEVRNGRCPEYVICDAILDERFLATARQLGAKGSDTELNTKLINLRKQKKLTDCPTTFRKQPDRNRHHYLNAVSNVVRLVERQFGKNVDDVICDPEMRSQFEAMLQFLSPQTSAFEARYAALSLRKANRLRPEPVGQIIRAVTSRLLSLVDLEDRISELPDTPGVYVFFDEGGTLYVGKADSLKRRIGDHISTWTYRDIIDSIRKSYRPDAFVAYHELPVKISPRELAAYETELIRSRNPQHNRAGRVP
jgi:hypothetical protein